LFRWGVAHVDADADADADADSTVVLAASSIAMQVVHHLSQEPSKSQVIPTFDNGNISHQQNPLWFVITVPSE
jgi:hypothetical protein